MKTNTKCYNHKLFRLFILFLILNLFNVYGQSTLRLYLIGNSVTDAINYNGLKALAESRSNTHTWARHMIPGAPLSWLWDHPADGFMESPYGYPNNAFPNYTWDAISLQPFDRGITGADGDATMYNNYVNLSKGKSPNCQYYIYMRWPRMPNNKNSLSACTECTADAWTTAWSAPSTNNEGKAFFEALLLETRRLNISTKQPLIVPVGEVFNNLNTKMKNGQIAGYSSIWQVYSDGIHMSGIGSYIAAVTYYSTLYKADPRGLGVPSDFGTMSSTLATAIQNAVWEVVSTYQYSGVSSVTNVAVTSVSVSPTTLSVAAGATGNLTATVSPSNATNKTVSWTSSNTNVAVVNSSGVVTGAAAGTATITATTADGNKTSTCAVTVTAGSGGGTNFTGVLASWDFATKGGQSSIASSVKATSISSANASLATGLSVINYLSNGLTGTNSTSNTLAEALAANDYISVTIAPSGGSMSITSIKIRPISQGRSRTFALFSSKNGFNAGNELSTFTNASEFGASLQNIAITNHSAITTSTEFRLYIYGFNNQWESVGMGNRTAGVAESDLIIEGSTSSGSTAVTGVTVSPTTLVLNPGVTSQLAATVAPVNATNKTVNWTSSNTSIATVNSSGLVTAVAAGIATITANTADGGRTATCSVRTNARPTAVLNASVTTGTAPLSVSFNSTGSSDPDQGDFILGYEWNFGNGSPVSNANTPSIVFSTAGTYNVSLRVMDNNNLQSDAVTRTITVGAASALRNPENPASTLNGLDYSYYEGSWDVLPNFGSLTANKSGNVANFDLSIRNVNDNFGVQFTGFIDIPADGTYTFYTSSDDGSKLFIGSTEVVNNDGLHGIEERSGTIGLKAGKHAIRVVFFEKTGGESLAVSYQSSSIAKQAIPTSALLRNNPIQTGTVVRETWTNVSGTTVNLIPTTPATSTSNLTSLEIPVNSADNFATRIRGFIIPSSSGAYTFYVSGDDDVELWMSTNNNPATRTKIADITNGWTDSRIWNKYPSQTSAARFLTAGTQYYFEALHKEGTGGDNLAIGWTGPGISTISVIGGSNIAPYTGTTPPPVDDTQAPSVPSGLSSASITQTSFTLNWAASTDNVGVTGYEVFRGGTSIGTPTTNSFAVSGLAAGTAYSMTVRARDAAGNWSAQSTALSVTTSAATPPPSGTPKLPIGMNINSTNYYTKGLIYTDVMCSASSMFSFIDGGSAWNTDQINNIPKDVNGYPTQLPFNVGGGNQVVRFLFNNNYVGRYVVLYDGVGQLRVNGVNNLIQNGRLYIDLTGQGGNSWIDILQSQSGNHVRNIRILPQANENGAPYPTFLAKFVDGLRPFHALRFMDWVGTNGSPQRNWSDRCTKTYYSQCTERGMSLEYAIELANLLNTGGWFCVPHLATDDYHRQMARLIRDNLNSNLKVYLEYSNEIWNWQFSQAGWIVNNAPGSTDTYVMTDLAALGAAGSNHPEKDAYMMARAFRLFKGEFTGANASRLIKISAVQHGWPDNTRRVLQQLSNLNQQCDWVSPGGYFNYGEADHNNWLQRCSAVTPAEVVTAASNYFDNNESLWTDQNAVFANQFGVGYAVYEGGQHMQPYLQGDWCYNQAVYDAQIHQSIYDLYMKNFTKHIQPNVNCKLFMAFSYIGERQSKFGSWGHLESLDQVGSSNMRVIAPKYQALLDANASKTSSRKGIETLPNLDPNTAISIYPNPAKDEVNIEGLANNSFVELISLQGVSLFSNSFNSSMIKISIVDYPKGLYLLKIKNSIIGQKTFKLAID